ncbi:putative transposase [Mangrovibacter plantisponsor]|uniref:Putative transposase n=1 Tax=Mangrovibacter plantisponsor TaxID=451513 RepID=A0A317Q5Q9_9ENTR|nr:putative transposase [Mangrovibacter plantisponsor]
MKKARFTETQIVNILKLADSGLKVEEICHQNGISNAIFYIYGLLPFCKH